MNRFLCLSFFFLLFMTACSDDNANGGDPADEQFDQNFIDTRFPELRIDLTSSRARAEIQLGRMLFYEQDLSRTGTIACASCHVQELGFADPNRFSFGVDSILGNRQAMTLANIGFETGGFFWDGRERILEHLTLLPIQNEIEMDESLESVISKLSAKPHYTKQFSKVFGDTLINEKKIGEALALFLSSMISNNSKYDQHNRGEVELTFNEERGEEIYLGLLCTNCHGGFNFDDQGNRFLNNGLDTEQEMTDFGRELVTNNRNDRGQFKVPSLRNIAVSAPYMHDGRFSTLEEVIDHYASGVKNSASLDGFLRGFEFEISDQDKSNLIEFMNTLTDESFLEDPAFSDPF